MRPTWGVPRRGPQPALWSAAWPAAWPASPLVRFRTVLAALGAVAVLAGLAAGPAAADPGRSLPATWAVGEPTSLELAADPAELPVGRPVTLSGRLTDPETGAAVTDAAVRLESLDPATGDWVPEQDLVTDPGGAVSATALPPRSTVYRLHHGEPGSTEESTSPEVRVHLTELTAGLGTDAVRAGHPARVDGVLVADPGSVLLLERRSGSRWTRVARTRSAPDQSYTFTVTPTEPGFWRWRVVRPAGAGSARLVAGLPRLDAFRLHTYSVVRRGAVRADLDRFRSLVGAIYADPRGWQRAHHRFREVPAGGAFTVVLSRPSHLPRFSSTCSTSYSCRVGRYVVVNAARWATGSPFFTGSLTTYRRYLLDHETGHWLGLGHAFCPRPGASAPVMQQQSKGMQGCRPNPWPRPREVSAVS